LEDMSPVHPMIDARWPYSVDPHIILVMFHLLLGRTLWWWRRRRQPMTCSMSRLQYHSCSTTVHA